MRRIFCKKCVKLLSPILVQLLFANRHLCHARRNTAYRIRFWYPYSGSEMPLQEAATLLTLLNSSALKPMQQIVGRLSSNQASPELVLSLDPTPPSHKEKQSGEPSQIFGDSVT